MGFQCINICQVPWEVLKTAAEKTMFDPYNNNEVYQPCDAGLHSTEGTVSDCRSRGYKLESQLNHIHGALS